MTNNEKKKHIKEAELKDFKAKIKAKIENSNQVFITTHKNPDLDAIASALGVSLIAKKLKKENYIIMDDSIDNINTGVLSIIDAISNDFEIITTAMYNEIKSNNDILFITDANKSNLVSCESYLQDFKSIIIIDHHNQDSKTIKTFNKFIYPGSSSASELVTAILEAFKINYGTAIANYLLAGIILDTNSFRSETSTSQTLTIVNTLLDKGANRKYADTLIDKTFATEVKVNDLIRPTSFYNYRVAICCGSNEEKISPEIIAKAADKLKEFADISCVVGRLDDNTISVSARSDGKIDVSKVMQLLGGGGDTFRGATKIKGETTDEVQKKLIKILKPSYYIEEKELKDEKD